MHANRTDRRVDRIQSECSAQGGTWQQGQPCNQGTHGVGMERRRSDRRAGAECGFRLRTPGMTGTR